MTDHHRPAVHHHVEAMQHRMISRCYVAVVAAAVGLIALLTSSDGVAQSYRFQVSEMDLQVHVQPNASARIEYRIVFKNQRTARPIDIIDIGLPHRDYSISNMKASIDGAALSSIRKSEYIDVGVEVPLGGRQIAPGNQGTFRFEALMPDMVYQDTTDKSRASLQMTPTWFDPQLQVGRTHLKIAVHLPPGVSPEEVTYHDQQTAYHQKVLFGEGDQQHVVLGWDWPQHSLSSSNPKIGVSFPKRTMNRVVTISTLGLLVKWFSERPEVQLWSGVALGILFLFTFFRFSHGTGWVLGLFLLGGLVWMMAASPALHLSAWLPMIGLCAWNEHALSRRQSTYLPAIAQVEGGGIKRGLTAPQAAVLLELPLGKVLTLVMFGLLKKGLVTMVSADPLTVEVNEEYRVSRGKRKKIASRAGIVIHNYEQPFLDRLIGNRGTPVEQIELQEPLKSLVVGTAGRMRGFDLSDSQEYYQRIVQRAWREAEAIGELDARTEAVDRNFDWMMLDPDWSGRFNRWGSGGYHYHPSWSRTHSGGTTSTSASPAATPSAPATPSTAKTSFGEVAGSFTGWAETTSHGLTSAIEPGSLGISTPRGLVDLSGVDQVTSDVFKALGEASRSSGGGGGGGGCACACAGCACACACAGGGR